jgi:antitoxin component YwqK of YwqJK toxin-antitoxin module
MDWYDDGGKMSESFYTYGILHGVSRKWYRNGKRRDMAKWDKKGVWTYWKK